MTRAALLPAGADPFLLAYWLRNYSRVWADEVDELHIYVCGQTDRDALEYITQLAIAAPHTVLWGVPHRTDHGAVIGALLERTTADLVMLCEDDAFVRHPGVIDERFRRIGRGDVDIVGTARGNATPNLIARAAEVFGPPPITESGETGNSLYPCFLFGRRDDLAGLYWTSKAWAPGDYIDALDYTCTAEEACDTGTYASWVLRSQGKVIDAEAAYRSNSAFPGDGAGRVDGGANNGDAPWFHVGSLSSGYGCAFMSGSPEAEAGLRLLIDRDQERIDWTKRASWWQRAYDLWDGGIPEHHAQTVAEFEALCRDTHIDRLDIAGWRHSYDAMISWDERP